MCIFIKFINLAHIFLGNEEQVILLLLYFIHKFFQFYSMFELPTDNI